MQLQAKERYAARRPKGKRAAVLIEERIPIRSEVMTMIVDKTGRHLCTTAEAAKEFGCRPSYIRTLASKGILWSKVESPRVVFYDLEQVKRVAKENQATRKKRGGRPPRGTCAA
jgi:hypothetical protein